MQAYKQTGGHTHRHTNIHAARPGTHSHTYIHTETYAGIHTYTRINTNVHKYIEA